MVIWNILTAACSAGTPLGTGHTQDTFKLSPSFPLSPFCLLCHSNKVTPEDNIPHALSWLDLELFP